MIFDYKARLTLTSFSPCQSTSREFSPFLLFSPSFQMGSCSDLLFFNASLDSHLSFRTLTSESSALREKALVPRPQGTKRSKTGPLVCATPFRIQNVERSWTSFPLRVHESLLFQRPKLPTLLLLFNDRGLSLLPCLVLRCQCQSSFHFPMAVQLIPLSR